MNNIKEIALRVAKGMNAYCETEYEYYTHRFYEFSERELADFAIALLAELSKDAEPVSSKQKKLIGWRTDNFLWETNDPDKARNWETNIGVLPIFEGDINTKLIDPLPQEAIEQRVAEACAKVVEICRANRFGADAIDAIRQGKWKEFVNNDSAGKR